MNDKPIDSWLNEYVTIPDAWNYSRELEYVYAIHATPRHPFLLSNNNG